MKAMSKRFQTLLAGGLILLFSFVAISYAGAQTCVQPPFGMTGWWPGDGNTDDIVGNRNAVLRDNATIGPGFVGEAFLLDGNGDFVEVPHDPALNVGTGDFTVDLWVNFNTTFGEQVLVEKYVEQFDPTINTGWTFTKHDDDRLTFGGADSGPLSIPTNTWIHFAARRSGDVQTIFMNGTLVATGPVDRDNGDSDSSLKFGHRGNPNDTPGSTDDRGFFLNGRIDEVELFVGRALSDTEIQAIFNAGSAGKCKEPDTVVIDGCDTAVPDTLFASGSTISDLIARCAEGASNHGKFVSCVSHLTNELQKDGIITGQQKGAIQSCAAQAKIP
jgi:hypothetical protein